MDEVRKRLDEVRGLDMAKESRAPEMPGASTLAAGQSIAGRERLLDRIETAEGHLMRSLATLRELKDRVRYNGLRDANLTADLVEQFARMNFLNFI